MKWEVESDFINMTLSIFKDLYIHGDIWLKEYNLNKDYIEYTILLDWYWKTFNGGENGILLGTTKYIAHKDLFPELDEDFIARYELLSKVRKIQGIEL